MNIYQQVFHFHANLLKALSHPKRLEIIQLIRFKTLSVSEIQQMLDLRQANLSQHLQILRQAEVVKTKKQGKQIYYRIAHKNFIKASDLLRQVLIEKHQNDKLSDALTYKMTDLVPVVSDPVCKMRISPKTAAFAISHHHKQYYFCASGCFKKFQENPQKYQKDE